MKMTNNTTLRNKVSRGSLERENLLEAKAEKIEMTLNTADALASGLLIQRLTELYEDPIEATVRETVSNALDAISGDGVVKVYNPNTLQPIFKVEDNGCGMSYEDLKEIYSKYGASTKRDNLEQIGAYGLGAKAPLAYGTEFTVSSVKDGFRTTIIVAREELTNYIKIVDSSETTDANGTTISIPVAHYDIEKFNRNIEKYRSNSLFKDGVALYIDDEEIKFDNYLLIADDMPIFKEADGEVKARIWVVKDSDRVVKLLSDMSKDDVKRQVKYVIGGWAYSSPSGRRNNYENTIMVELKPGVVSFNSARDAILDNERYNDLQELVVEYIASKKMLENFQNAINRVEIDFFTKVMKSILLKDQKSIEFKNGKVNIQKNNRSSYFTPAIPGYTLDGFVHEETGFSVGKMLESLPGISGKFAVTTLSKRSYKATADSEVLTKGKTDSVKFPYLSGRNISEVNELISSTLSGETESLSISEFVLFLIINENDNEKQNSYFNFITDVKYSGEKGTDFMKVRSGRRTINKMNGCEHLSAYKSYTIYTEHSKADVEKILNHAKIDMKNTVIATASEFVLKINEYRKANRSEVKKNNARFTTNVRKYNHLRNALETIASDEVTSTIEVKDGLKNIIILSKAGQIRPDSLRLIHAWYCNENKVKKEDVAIYTSIGIHRITELELLNELGELHQAEGSTEAGTSNLYKEIVKRKELGYNLFYNDEEDVNKKAFIRMVQFIARNKYYGGSVFTTIQEELLNIKMAAKIAKIETEETPKVIIEELNEILESSLGGKYNRSWCDSNFDKEHLASLLTDEQKELIQKLGFLKASSPVLFKENAFEIYNVQCNQMSLDYDSIQSIYSKGTENVVPLKLLRNQFEQLVEESNQINKDLMNIKFI